MIKLREILSMPVFRNFRVVAGEGGIDREVGTVSVMDAPDIYKWRIPDHHGICGEGPPGVHPVADHQPG